MGFDNCFTCLGVSLGWLRVDVLSLIWWVLVVVGCLFAEVCLFRFFSDVRLWVLVCFCGRCGLFTFCCVFVVVSFVWFYFLMLVYFAVVVVLGYLH